MIRKIVSGNVVERSKVYILSEKPIRRHKVKGNTSAKKADANANAEVRVLTRELNSNFSLTRSLLLGLDYDDAHLPESLGQCKKDAANFLRCLKRELKKAGAENVRTVTVVSDMDGETGEKVREHVHIVITGEGISFRDGFWWAGEKRINDIWKRGGSSAKNVRYGGDLTGLANYLLKQARREKENDRKWIPSRNLAKPEVTEEEARPGEMKVPTGVIICERHYDIETGYGYMRYIKPVKRSGEEEGTKNGGRPHRAVPTEEKGESIGKGRC